ncbi:hypothetical protein V3C99_010627 [Haemonchus contortus]
MNFAAELIHSTRFDENGKWSPRGRRVEKAFLYDIVANENDSCDVDKFDYLIRDSLSAGIPIPFNKRSIERLMENARVLLDPGHGFPRICYAKKVADVVLSIGDSRQMLHNLLYQHRVVSAIEEMVVRALRLVDRHFRYMGDDGRSYSLSEMPQNLGAFIKTSDSILKEIANSMLPEMAEAQNMLKDIEKRNLPVKLDEVQCGSSWVDEPHASFIGKAPKLRDVERLIRQRIQDELGENIDDEEFMVLVRAMHRGLDGKSHPMSRVLLYDNKKKDISVAYTDKKWLQLKSPEEAAIWTIRLYVARSMPEADRSQVAKAFDKIVTSIGLRQTVDSALAG